MNARTESGVAVEEEKEAMARDLDAFVFLSLFDTMCFVWTCVILCDFQLGPSARVLDRGQREENVRFLPLLSLSLFLFLFPVPFCRFYLIFLLPSPWPSFSAPSL